MSIRNTALALSIVGLILASSDALGCGESMFRSGQGMRYHAFMSRQPADILIFRHGAPEASPAQKQLYAGLKNAGHKITVISNDYALDAALASKHYDVVIASVRDMDAIAARVGTSARDPALLAVLGNDPAERPQGERFPRNVREGDGVVRYLKSIEQTMLARRS